MAPSRELIRTRCTDGWLIITETAIRVERKGFLGAGAKTTVLPRSALVAADSTNKLGSMFGQGGATTLTFTGQGATILVVKMVNPRDAQRIMELLGFA